MDDRTEQAAPPVRGYLRVAWADVFAGGVFFSSFALVTLLVHLAVGEGYGYFRDEFYYLEASRHLDWGYVDQPPLSIVLLWAWRHLAGESVMAIRLLPAFAHAGAVWLTGWMARELGGRLFAQALAMTSVLVAPLYLGLTGFYSMNAFDVLIWTIAAALLIRIIGRERPRLWLALGLVLGLGLMNKISVLWLGSGIFIGLVVTSRRRALATAWPWLGAAIATLAFAPYLVWQVVHGWPTLEFIRNATGEKMIEVAPIDFLAGQLSGMHPLNTPVWLAGLAFLLFGPTVRPYRLLAVIYLAAMAILMLNGTSRSGYLAPAYTMLFAAGGVAWERLTPGRIGGWARPAILAVLFAGGAALAPLALPILPVESYIRYAAALGVEPSTDERKELGALPQHYADMFGWEQIVDQVAEVYERLPPEERRVAAIFVYNYGEAGAIDLLGRRRGLPGAISGHNNYWLWGPRGHTGEVVIIIGGTESGHRASFASVEHAGTTSCGYCMPYEDGQPIFVARGLLRPIDEVWPNVKHFD